MNINILLAKISVRDGEEGSSSTSRRVRHLNDLAKVIIIIIIIIIIITQATGLQLSHWRQSEH